MKSKKKLKGNETTLKNLDIDPAAPPLSITDRYENLIAQSVAEQDEEHGKNGKQGGNGQKGLH